MAEAHGNRTHQGGFSPPSPVLKTGSPTSDDCASVRIIAQSCVKVNFKVRTVHEVPIRLNSPSPIPTPCLTAVKLRAPPPIGGRLGGGSAAERSRKSTQDDRVTPPLSTYRISCRGSAGFPLPVPSPAGGGDRGRVDP